jgi:hypothetical protein
LTQELNLPDTFDVQMARKLSAVIEEVVQEDEPDFTKVMQVANHLVAESDVPPGEREQMQETLLSTMLFKLSTIASERGEKDRAERCLAGMTLLCSRETIETTLAGGLFSAGVHQGWLPAAHYDRVAARIGELPPEVRKAFAGVERREES